MTIQIDVTELGPKSEELVNDVAENGGEIRLTRNGKAIARLIRMDTAGERDEPSTEERVLYKGEWMSRAGADRERSIEHLHGSVKILGDIVSPIDDVEWDALK